MNSPSRPVPRIEFDAFGAAVGAALVCGGLSILFSPLLAPTATLAALAVAGWASLLRRRQFSWFGVERGTAFSLCVLGGAAAAFLLDPPALAPVRGFLLGGSLLPLFISESRRSAFPAREPTP